MNTLNNMNTLIPQSTRNALEIPPKAAESATESSTSSKSDTPEPTPGQSPILQSFKERQSLIELHAHRVLQDSLVNAESLLERTDELLRGGNDEYGQQVKQPSIPDQQFCYFEVPMHPDSPISTGYFLVHYYSTRGFTIITTTEDSLL
jgi:hypothetical protein